MGACASRLSCLLQRPVWEYLDEHNEWKPVAARYMDKVEHAYCSDCRTCEAIVGNRKYDVDLEGNIQTNKVTKVQRHIRRRMASDAREEIRELKTQQTAAARELAATKEEVSQLKREISQLKEEQTAAARELAAKKEEVSKLNTDISQLKTEQNAAASDSSKQLAAKKEEISKLNTEISQLKTEQTAAASE